MGFRCRLPSPAWRRYGPRRASTAALRHGSRRTRSAELPRGCRTARVWPCGLALHDRARPTLDLQPLPKGAARQSAQLAPALAPIEPERGALRQHPGLLRASRPATKRRDPGSHTSRAAALSRRSRARALAAPPGGLRARRLAVAAIPEPTFRALRLAVAADPRPCLRSPRPAAARVHRSELPNDAARREGPPPSSPRAARLQPKYR